MSYTWKKYYKLAAMLRNMKYRFHKKATVLKDDESKNLSATLAPLDQDLLLFCQILHNLNRNLQNSSDDICWRKCQPLGERNIRHSVALVQLDPSQVLGG